MGYAYILTHPGTPTVFWDHYFDWGDDLKKQISSLLRARDDAGIHSRSKLEIVAATDSLYAAHVGDRLAVKLGGDWSPSGTRLGRRVRRRVVRVDETVEREKEEENEDVRRRVEKRGGTGEEGEIKTRGYARGNPKTGRGRNEKKKKNVPCLSGIAVACEMRAPRADDATAASCRVSVCFKLFL